MWGAKDLICVDYVPSKRFTCCTISPRPPILLVQTKHFMEPGHRIIVQMHHTIFFSDLFLKPGSVVIFENPAF